MPSMQTETVQMGNTVSLSSAEGNSSKHTIHKLKCLVTNELDFEHS